MEFERLNMLRGIVSKIPLLSANLVVHDMHFSDSKDVDFPHAHSSSEIYYIFKGEAGIMINGEPVRLRAGDLIYVSPRTLHGFQFSPAGEYTYCNLAFDIAFNKPIDESISEFVRDERFLIEDTLNRKFAKAHDTYGCIEELTLLCRGLEHRFTGEYLKTCLRIAAFFISALQAFAKASWPPDFDVITGRVENRNANRALKLASYIWENCAEEITVTSISAELGYSSRHVQRIISEYFGVSFSELLLRYRIGRAKLLLISTQCSVEQISGEVGFKDSKTFSRHFKADMAISPSEFRRRMKAGENGDR